MFGGGSGESSSRTMMELSDQDSILSKPVTDYSSQSWGNVIAGGRRRRFGGNFFEV